VLAVVYVWVEVRVAVPPLPTVAVLEPRLELSPQSTDPARESPTLPVQVRVAVTVWPVWALVGKTPNVQVGGGTITVIANDDGVILAKVLLSVVSVRAAVMEKVLAFVYV